MCKISTDSPSDITAELAQGLGVTVMPLHIILGGRDYLDGVDITPDIIENEYSSRGVLPSTAAISVGEYEEKFRELTADGSELVHIAISSGVSSSCANAKAAAKNLDGVFVVDSLQLSTAVTLLAVKASGLAGQGKSAKEITAAVENMRSRIDISFVLDTLDFMAKGGRCSAVTALGANLLSIRPCLEMRGGTLAVCKKYRGKTDRVQRQYIDERVGQMGECDREIAFVTHSKMSDEQVKSLVELVEKSGKFDRVIASTAGCTITSHCGPNCVGVIALKK